MASNFDCIGLVVESEGGFESFIQSIVPKAESIGRRGSLHVLRWDDPSGARLVIRIRGREFVGLTPSFAGTPGAHLAAIQRVADEVWSAAVVDAGGEQVTAATFDLEEADLSDDLEAARPASIVALGHDVAIFPDEAAFAASNASLMDPNAPPSEPPENAIRLGIQWPPRVGAESFISIGVFAAPADASAFARLHGVVLRAEARTNQATGRQFGVCRVRTVGMEVDLCVASDDHPRLPEPGQLIGGIVYLSASIGAPAARASLASRMRARLS